MDQAPARVVIFDPAPIFTVTIENGERPEVHFHLGGQGAWIGRMIRLLGGEAVMCGPLGGESGAVLRVLADDDRTGVPLRSIASAGANGGYIHDRRGGQRTEIVEVPPPALTRHEADDLYNLVLQETGNTDVLVLTGVRRDDVLPRGLYERLPRDAAALGCKVVADLDRRTMVECGQPLEIAKVSHLDLVGGDVENSTEGLAGAAMRLRSQGTRCVVVSRGADAILALIDQTWFRVEPPDMHAVEPRGAGDAMTGMLAYAVATGLAPEPMLRMAAAAGAVNVTRHGHGGGLRSTIEQLAGRVGVRRLHGPPIAAA